MVQHIFNGVWGPNLALLSLALRSLCRFLPPTASCSPLILLLLDHCYLPIAILGIRQLVLPPVEACVVFVVGGGGGGGGGVVEVGIGGGVVEIGVALVLVPLAPIGTI